MDGQPLLVEPCAEDAGQHVGPVGGHSCVPNPGVEYPSKASHTSLEPYASGDRGDHVNASHQRRGQSIEVSDRLDPTSGCGELSSGNRVLANDHDLHLARLADGHSITRPIPEDPRAAGRVADLLDGT